MRRTPMVALASCLAQTAPGHAAAVTEQPVLTERLPNLPGKSITMMRVTIASNGAAVPHRHAGSVAVYVLSGALRSKLNDGPTKIFHAGEAKPRYRPAGAARRGLRADQRRWRQAAGGPQSDRRRRQGRAVLHRDRREIRLPTLRSRSSRSTVCPATSRARPTTCRRPPLAIEDGRVVAIYQTRNPDKLGHVVAPSRGTT